MKHKNSIERKSENMRCGKRVIALMVAGVFGITVTNGSVPVYAMEMPGRRYDIGNLESYRQVEEEYKGIVHKA